MAFEDQKRSAPPRDRAHQPGQAAESSPRFARSLPGGRSPRAPGQLFRDARTFRTPYGTGLAGRRTRPLRSGDHQPFAHGPWPGVALVPLHSGAGHQCASRAPTRPRASGESFPCPRTSVRTRASSFRFGVRTPPDVHAARLDVHLTQVGGGSLARCGLPPISMPLALAQRPT